MKRIGNTCIKFFTGHFNTLLLSLLLLFACRPYHRGGIYMGIWQLLFIVVFFSSIFNCKHPKYVSTISIILGVPALILNWTAVFHQTTLVVTLYLVLVLIFILVCASSIIYKEVISARVTLNTLKGVICAYFMIAFAFAYCYFLIETLFPNSFFIASPDISIVNPQSFLSEMMYFSFVTLLTTGYGDIIAIHELSQTFTIFEGVIGQFYIAILVARLVGVYSFFSEKTLLKQIEKGRKKKSS